jgi:predicted permease
MSSFSSDLRFAFRTLRRSPAFAAIAILTLALGIGATTAIFSVVHAVLIRPLPYDHPEQLAIVWGELRARQVYDWTFAPGDLKDLADQTPAFSGVTGLQAFNVPLTIENAPPRQLRAIGATPNVFTVLGVRPRHGRLFRPEDGAVPPPPPADAPQGQAAPPLQMAVLSYELFRDQFGGDSSIVGTNITIGNNPWHVVGVLEPGVELHLPPNANLPRLPDAWVAARIDFDNAPRNNVGWFAIGRMKPGVSVSTAHLQAEQVSAELRERFPLKKTVDLHFRVEGLKEDVVATVRPTIRALMGAVLFVLAIACANVANLLLVRVSQREREMVVRAAVGGSRWVLARQLLAESLILSLLGGALGVVLAQAGVDLLLAIAPPDLPRLADVRIDIAVLMLTLVACVASAVLFGLVPALHASRPDLTSSLRASGRGVAASGARLRQGVVTVEVALSFVLLIGCGLMIRTAIALHRVDPGFRAEGLLTLTVGNLRVQGADGRAAKTGEIRERLLALPGVTHVSAITTLPLDGRGGSGRWGPEAARADQTLYRQGHVEFVRADYFETMGTRVIAGRTFREEDNVPTARVVIIDERIAEMGFPGQSPIGRRILSRVTTPEAELYEIIGVVSHQRHQSLAGDEAESLYFPDGNIGVAAASWAVRTTGDVATLAPMARSTLLALDPQLLITDVEPMTGLIGRASAATRFALALFAVFAVLAALLAAIGLYGVLSSIVRQRVPEIGMRMAVGATPANIFRLVIGHGLALSAAGIATGLFAAFLLTRVIARLLVGVQPTDPLTFATMIAAFLGIAVLASWLPARRAAGIDPNTALREG